MTHGRALVALLAAGYAVLWCGGVVSYLAWGRPPDDAAWTPSTFLLLAGALSLSAGDARRRTRLAVCGIAGLLVEIAGVRLGFPFGRYHYTGALLPLVAGVPLAMFAPWVVLVDHAGRLAARAGAGRTAAVVAGSLWMTAIDLVVDPVAAGPLRYWVWEEGGAWYGVPLSNFAGWIAVSATLLAVAGDPGRSSGWSRGIGASVLGFLTVVALGARLWIPAAIGLALLALQLLVELRPGLLSRDPRRNAT